MRIISHRGNLRYPGIPSLENCPKQIGWLLEHHPRFDVEVDLWDLDGELFLCHDLKKDPHYKTDLKFLLDHKERLFVHCKNADALMLCSDLHMTNYFAHDKDPFVITSSGLIWTYPDPTIPLTAKSIPVVYNRYKAYDMSLLRTCAGICTDDPIWFYDELSK